MVTTPPLPPSFTPQVPLIRKMRTAHFRGDAWQKCDFAALYYTLLRVQRHAAAHRKARFSVAESHTFNWGATSRCPRFITLCCGSITKRLAGQTESNVKACKGWSAPRSGCSGTLPLTEKRGFRWRNIATFRFVAATPRHSKINR